MYMLKQGGRVDYSYKEFYLDTEDELSQININLCCPGSVAYIIATKKVFILNSKKEWKEQ